MIMTQKIIYAVYPENECALQNFMERLLLLKIYTKPLKSTDKYKCFESTWEDTEIPEQFLKNSRNAGAKIKQLEYKGKSVSCGSVWQLKYYKNFSNKKIGQLFDVSESTINRRIKRHLSDGNFYENSKIIF